MIKSKRLAYDGRGNAVANSADELSAAVSGDVFKTLKVSLLYNYIIFFLNPGISYYMIEPVSVCSYFRQVSTLA